jgi:hypothetical protein
MENVTILPGTDDRAKTHHEKPVEPIATKDRQITEDAIQDHKNFSGLVTEEQL